MSDPAREEAPLEGTAAILPGPPPVDIPDTYRQLLWEPGSCSSTELQGVMARAFAEALARGLLPFARLEACRRYDVLEVVVFEVEVELVQRVVHDIRYVERLAVVFNTEAPNEAPEVLALREDFPVDAPHINLRRWAYPRSLCLYDVAFRDVRVQWTPARFMTLIREWLRLTARGELHADDQPLEPLLPAGSGWVILPAELRETALRIEANSTHVLQPSLIFEGQEHQGRPVLIGWLVPSASANNRPRGMATVMRMKPRTHGVIRQTPSTLGELHAMLADEGDDLLHALRGAFRGLEDKARHLADLFVLILLVPQRRHEDEQVERVETLAFFSENVGKVGVEIGAWEIRDGVPGALLVPGEEQDGRRVSISLASTFFRATREDLARFSGTPAPDERSIVAIGGGALGAQVLLNAARAAFGRWIVLDEDIFLPHNVARHGLPADAVGWSKAVAVAMIANGLAEGTDLHTGITVDVLNPGSNQDALSQALNTADLIVDLSASVTVARALARDIAAPARRISAFLSPSGRDLTILAEDVARRMPLDALEMQSYRAMVRDEDLGGLFDGAVARVRYGRTCRDVSGQLPQALVAVHAGLTTLALQQIASTDDARASVWRVDPASLAVCRIEVPLVPVLECQVGLWRLVTDTMLVARLCDERNAKLPNETGGVLLGTYDFSRKIVYVVDAISSPRDSREAPSSYYRGCEGLLAEVERVEAVTAGQLHYLGEWHSHPHGQSCWPSDADAKLFAWIGKELEPVGLPPLMLIVGDDGVVPYLDHLPDGNLQGYPAVVRPDPSA